MISISLWRAALHSDSGVLQTMKEPFHLLPHIVHSAKCHITSQSSSLRVRLARNWKAFHYPSQVFFKDIDPTWKCGDLALPGSILGTSELHPEHVSKDVKIESSIQDLEMHGEKA